MTPKPIQGRAFFPNLLGGIVRTANPLNRIRSRKKKSGINLTVVDSESATDIVTPDSEKIEVAENQPLETSKCMTLPNELFSEIFTLCLPHITTNPANLQQWFPNIDYFAVDLCVTRRSLSQVCRRWKGVINSTPGMWTSLVLGRSLKWDEEALKVNLERSGECLLDIYIRPKVWAGSKSRVTKLLKIVRGHTHRLRAFMVDHIYWDELLGLFPLKAEPMMMLPELQTFVIRQYTPGFPISTESDLIMGRVYTPCLQYLDLAEAIIMNSFMTISLPHLRNLNLASPKYYVLASTYYQFLACCPNLVSLGFTRSSVMPPLDLETEAPEHRLILPMVENFEFMQDHTPDTVFLVRSLQLPELKSLKFGQFETTRREPGFIHEFFSQLMVENAATLQHLSLLQGSIPVEDTFYPPLIKTMRNLQSLVFDNVLLQDDIIDALMPDSEDPSDTWPCPKLRTLTIDQIDIDGDRLVELLKIRTPSDKVLRERAEARKEAAKELIAAAEKTLDPEKPVTMEKEPVKNADTEEKPVPEPSVKPDREAANEEEPKNVQELTKEGEPVKERESPIRDGSTKEHQSPAVQEPESTVGKVSAKGSESVTEQKDAEEEFTKEGEEESLAEETRANGDAASSDESSVSSSSMRTSIFPIECDDGYFSTVIINRCTISNETTYKSFIDLNRVHGSTVRFFY